MNYRHIYHAGNICDVVKHSALALVLEHLCAKDAPLAVLDTHAGVGLYNLEDERARKTGEADAGIRMLLNAASSSSPLTPYLRAVHTINQDKMGLHYPGSPLLARSMLRAQDRLMACELHPEDARELRRLFSNDPQVHIHQRDGFEALGALLPPKEKRGLVFVDPPFEQSDEYARLTAMAKTHAKLWPQACLMIWYPIKNRPEIWRFHEELSALSIPKILCAEFIYREETRADILCGSGLILVNPPWQFDFKLQDVFDVLHRLLETPHRASSLSWLATD